MRKDKLERIDIRFKMNIDKLFEGEKLSMREKTKKLNPIIEDMIYNVKIKTIKKG